MIFKKFQMVKIFCKRKLLSFWLELFWLSSLYHSKNVWRIPIIRQILECNAGAYCSKSLPWIGFSLTMSRRQVSSFQKVFRSSKCAPPLCTLVSNLRRLVNDTGIYYEICMFCKHIYVFMSFYMSCAENASPLLIVTMIIRIYFWVFSSLASLLSPTTWNS